MATPRLSLRPLPPLRSLPAVAGCLLIAAVAFAGGVRADGTASNEACESNTLDAPGNQTLRRYEANGLDVIAFVCIASSGSTFHGEGHSVELGDGIYNRHGIALDESSADACYRVEGVGTASITVRRLRNDRQCRPLKHVDVALAQANPEPAAMLTEVAEFEVFAAAATPAASSTRPALNATEEPETDGPSRPRTRTPRATPTDETAGSSPTPVRERERPTPRVPTSSPVAPPTQEAPPPPSSTAPAEQQQIIVPPATATSPPPPSTPTPVATPTTEIVYEQEMSPTSVRTATRSPTAQSVNQLADAGSGGSGNNLIAGSAIGVALLAFGGALVLISRGWNRGG